jgi:hypothetical protein
MKVMKILFYPQTIFAKVSSCVIRGKSKSYRLAEPIGLSLADDLCDPTNAQIHTYYSSTYSMAFDAKDIDNNVIGFDGIKVSVSVASDFPGIYE